MLTNPFDFTRGGEMTKRASQEPKPSAYPFIHTTPPSPLAYRSLSHTLYSARWLEERLRLDRTDTFKVASVVIHSLHISRTSLAFTLKPHRVSESIECGIVDHCKTTVLTGSAVIAVVDADLALWKLVSKNSLT